MNFATRSPLVLTLSLRNSRLKPVNNSRVYYYQGILIQDFLTFKLKFQRDHVFATPRLQYDKIYNFQQNLSLPQISALEWTVKIEFIQTFQADHLLICLCIQDEPGSSPFPGRTNIPFSCISWSVLDSPLTLIVSPH